MGLTAEDFAVILNGSPEVDAKVMQQRCNSFGNGTDTERWFWEVVSQELTDLERSMLLSFWTGDACIPADVESWHLSVSLEGRSERLPTSATCSLHLRLPQYATKEIMTRSLRNAIQETSYQNA